MKHYHWYLLVEGAPVAWYSPTAPAQNPATSTILTSHPGLSEPTPSTAEDLDLSTCIVGGGSWNCKLQILDGNSASDLLRISPRGSDSFLTLKTSILQDSALTTIDVEEDISAWATSGTIYIGQEAIRYTGTDTGTNQFTGITRGYKNSRRRSHVVRTPKLGGAPKVYSNCISWLNRGAILYAADVPIGSAAYETDWFEVCRGYLRDVPEYDEEGYINLTITPYTALNRSIGGKELSTGLLDGYHAFDGSNASRMSPLYLEWKKGAAYDVRTDGDTVATSVFINNAAWAQHQAIFDVTSNDRDLRGPVIISGRTIEYYPHQTPATAYTGNGTNASLSDFYIDTTIHTTGLPAITTGQRIQNAWVHDVIQPTICSTPTMFRWPSGVISLLNEAMEPGTLDAWAWMKIDWSSEEDSWILKGRLNSDIDPSKPLRVEAFPIGSRDQLWYGGLDWSSSEDPMMLRTHDASEADRKASDWESKLLEVDITNNSTISLWETLPIRTPSNAFYQNGESYLLVEDDVFEGRTEFDLIVDSVGPGGEIEQSILNVTNVEDAATVFSDASLPGYVLTIAAPSYVKSFGNWPGQDKATISMGLAFRDISPIDLLLYLLLSSEGRGYTHAIYDKLPYGMGLTSTDVDIASFKNFPLPGGAVSNIREYIIGTKELSLEEIVGSVLRMLGAALTTKINPTSGIKQVALINALSLPSQLDSIDHISNWAVDGQPKGEIISDLENVLSLKIGPDELEVRIENIALIREYGTGAAAFEEVVPWLTIIGGSAEDAKAALLPVAQQRWALFGHPRLRINGTISLEQSERLSIGDVITITAPRVRSYSSIGLDIATCRITSIERDLYNARCQIGLDYFGNNSSGYAPACKVAGWSSTTVLVMEANYYSPTIDPITGETQTDTSRFRTGDWVRVHGLHRSDVSFVRKILTVVGNTVTFTDPHYVTAALLATYDYIMVPVENNLQVGTSPLLDYVQLASDNGVIGSLTSYDDGLMAATRNTYLGAVTDYTYAWRFGTSSIAATAIGDLVYMGHKEKFNQVVFDVTALATITMNWEYWNGGAWSALTVSSSPANANNLQVDGTVSWTAPANWQPTLYSSFDSLYYVRLVCTSITGTGRITKITPRIIPTTQNLPAFEYC